jgi:hypothetical protein
MSQNISPDQISKKRVVYTIAGMDRVTVRRDEPYQATDPGPLGMDVYYPPDATAGVRRPAVVFVTGFSDAGAERMLGCRLKEMGSYVSWAQLAAATGLVAITYVNRAPASDVDAVLHHVRQHAEDLGVDDRRIGLWACSGSGPTALSVLTRQSVTCAALCYPFTIDVAGTSEVSAAAGRFGFVNASAGTSIADLPGDLPLFIARAGRDQMPGLNAALDRFVGAALAANLPMTVVNHATGPHGFDLFDDGDTSREIVRQILAFLGWHLLR